MRKSAESELLLANFSMMLEKNVAIIWRTNSPIFSFSFRERCSQEISPKIVVKFSEPGCKLISRRETGSGGETKHAECMLSKWRENSSVGVPPRTGCW